MPTLFKILPDIISFYRADKPVAVLFCGLKRCLLLLHEICTSYVYYSKCCGLVTVNE